MEGFTCWIHGMADFVSSSMDTMVELRIWPSARMEKGWLPAVLKGL